jgi:hypothetical protein
MGDVVRPMEIEYAGEDVNLHRDLMRRGARVGMLSSSTGGDLHRSARWREIYQPCTAAPGGGRSTSPAGSAASCAWSWPSTGRAGERSRTIEVVCEGAGRVFSGDEAGFARRLAPPVATLLRDAQARAGSLAGLAGRVMPCGAACAGTAGSG